MKRPVVIALWAASIVAAVVIARPSEQPAATPSPPTREVVREMRAAAAPSGLSAEDVRRVVRDEIARSKTDALPEPVADDADDAPAQEVVAEARAVVSRAIDSGWWTDASRDELRTRVSSLPRADLDAMLSELFVALNAGRVRADVRGPLF